MLKSNNKQRNDLRTICISPETWQMAKELSDEEEHSVSSFIRKTIKELYKDFEKNKSKLESTEQ